jgi:hypothetical protein
MNGTTKITTQLSVLAARRAVLKAGGDPTNTAQVAQMIADSTLKTRVQLNALEGYIRTMNANGYVVA